MDDHDRRLLTDIHGIVSGIKPVLDSHTLSLTALDGRTRGLEIAQSVTDSKTQRIQSDLDGLGRKVRAVGERARLPEPAKGEGGRWFKFLELLVEAPKYVHVFITMGSLVTTAAIILVRHWPK